MNNKKLQLTEHSQKDSYCNLSAPKLERVDISVTLDEAVKHVFAILDIRAPSAEQMRFARAEIQLAKRNRTFNKLVFLLSSLMGNSEYYYNNHYTFV